ncbi:MAG TPA: hypothetical protein VK479_08560 [Micropepsaceae bacterium]|nr:hypothetical protein [Micropepsaceae bacterium]
MGNGIGENWEDDLRQNPAEEIPSPRLGARFRQWFRPGVISSLLLHGLAAFFLLMQLKASLEIVTPVVPVDVVQLDEETVAPPPLEKTAGPQQRKAAAPPRRAQELASRELPSFRPPTGIAPAEPQPPPEKIQEPRDELQIRLEALAKLRQPESGARSGVSDRSASNGAALGPRAAYSVKDLVRAQVERRWSLDLEGLGARNFVVAIHVVLTRDGTVTKAEIVDQERFLSDATYHSIALSARNAVLLSSPIALPKGAYDDLIDMILNLNPRDALR